MITKRIWRTMRKSRMGKFAPQDVMTRHGWFLLGIIPLYIRDVKLEYRE